MTSIKHCQPERIRYIRKKNNIKNSHDLLIKNLHDLLLQSKLQETKLTNTQ